MMDQIVRKFFFFGFFFQRQLDFLTLDSPQTRTNSDDFEPTITNRRDVTSSSTTTTEIKRPPKTRRREPPKKLSQTNIISTFTNGGGKSSEIKQIISHNEEKKQEKNQQMDTITENVISTIPISDKQSHGGKIDFFVAFRLFVKNFDLWVQKKNRVFCCFLF